MTVFLIILLATLENMWPLIAGYLKAPPGYVFLGTVHHPADYFYYLSQFAQGANRWITSVDLFTGEPVAPTYVGWSNVLLGRIFHEFGVSSLAAYHISVAVFTVLLFIGAYKLALSILNSRLSAVLTLYVFALFHAFPILRDGKPSYGDYYNNFAVPRVRLGGVPHQLLLALASVFLVYFAVQWIQYKSSSWKTLLGLGISSFVLASLQPVLWVLVVSVLILTCATTNRKFLFRRAGLLLFTTIMTGLPPLLYLNQLFQSLPFSQLRIWEAAQQTPLTLEHFLYATGPIFILSLFTLPSFLHRVSFARLFVAVFPLISIALFLSPIPALLSISHVRMMSTLVILCLSAIASSGLETLGKRVRSGKPLLRQAVSIFIVAFLTVYLLPNHIKTIELAGNFQPDNTFQYLPKTDFELLLLAGKKGTMHDTFLVEWPYSVVFPAISGQRSYQGHPLLTIRSNEKNQFTDTFFSGTLNTEDMNIFLANAHITYILARTGNRSITAVSGLTQIGSSNNLVLYQVRK